MSRGLISIVMATVLVAIATTSFRLFILGYEEWSVVLHVLSGSLFLFFAGFHVFNNLKSLRIYFLKRRLFIPALTIAVATPFFAYSDSFDTLGKWYSQFRVENEKKLPSGFSVYEKSHGGRILELTVKNGPHFWYPQIAIWVEDEEGNYLQTLMVTYSTAKGVFYGNRTKDNFKDYDGAKSEESNRYRRVDALPHWSHKRDKQYSDGKYSPTPEEPLVDAVSGATPSGSFVLDADVVSNDTLLVKMELNVAFDDNEYFSEFSFPEDNDFHGGTGLLGQPSVIYEAKIFGGSGPVFLELVGHGHHSGADGNIYKDLSGLTTALEIIDWAVLDVSW